MSFKFLENPSVQKKALTVGTAVCVLAAGWQLYHVLSGEAPAAKPIPIVRVTTVAPDATNQLEVYPGEVRGRYESNLAFQVAGKIVSRQINIGDEVAAGQILMTLDPQDIQQAVNASAAQVSAAQAQYKLAADNVRRFEQLYQSGAVSQANLDQYRTQLEAAASNLQQAQAQAISNGNKLDYTQLRSDAHGVVANLNGEIGQVVNAGTPVVTVVQDGEREIQIFVPENRVQQLRVGQKAKVSFWALGDLVAPGVISEIAPMADPMTKTYRVRVALDKLPEQVKLGMTAKVDLNQTGKAQIVLPASAIYQTDDQSQVWVIRDNKAHLVPVTIGGHQGNDVIIATGLQAGDTVVTAGINKLLEDQEVRIKESGEVNEKG